MRQTSGFPKPITVGNVTVKVYRVKHKTTASGFAYTVVWKSAAGRKLSQFSNEADAITEARVKASQLAAGRIEGANMTSSDRDELQAARAIAGGVPLLAALNEWARIREVTQGHGIAAAETWARRNVAKHERLKVAEVVKKFLAAKTAAGIETASNHGGLFVDVKNDLGALYLDSISSIQLTAWLAKRTHPSTRNTYRKHVVAMFRWAQRQGYLPREQRTEAEMTDRASEAPHEIGIITVETFSALLSYFRTKHPEYLPALVLAGFCGLRRSEVHSQKWSDIQLDRGHVRVSYAKKGTPSKRLVPLCPAAVGWLKLTEDRTEHVCGNLSIDRIRDIARGEKFGLPENAFRHSFISHRVAQTGNVAETSLEAGNSPAIIFKHYRELVAKSEGEAWFALRPA